MIHTYSIHNTRTGAFMCSRTASDVQTAMDDAIADFGYIFSPGRYAVSAPSGSQFGMFDVDYTDTGVSFEQQNKLDRNPSGKGTYSIHLLDTGEWLTTVEAGTPLEAVEKAARSRFLKRHMKVGVRVSAVAPQQRAVGLFTVVAGERKPIATRVVV